MSLLKFSWRKLLHNYKLVEFEDGKQGVRKGYLWHRFLDFHYTRTEWTDVKDTTNRSDDSIKVNFRYQNLVNPPKKVKPYRIVG